MAHKDWCGKPCSQCISVCTLYGQIPCSPDCAELQPDGTPGGKICLDCDAVQNKESYAGIMDKEELIQFICNGKGWTRAEAVRFLTNKEYKVLSAMYDTAYSALATLASDTELDRLIPASERLF